MLVLVDVIGIVLVHDSSSTISNKKVGRPLHTKALVGRDLRNLGHLSLVLEKDYDTG